MGSNLPTLVRVLAANGFVPARRLPHVLMALGAALLRWPFSAAERVWVARRRQRQPPVPPPLFIVGHWRSGTTHLYNVLSKAPDLGYVSPFATALPWDFLGLGALLAPALEQALPSNRFIDRIPVRVDSPQEDETALSNMQPVSFYHGLYFPRHFQERFYEGIFFEGCTPEQIAQWQRQFTYFVEKLSMQQPGKRLLIKNPVYTARVAMLRRLYPGAKFIHIYRNPYRVFLSTRRFYEVLFQELALQPYHDVPVEEIILEAYPRMMDRLLADMAALPEGDGAEVRFEDFEAAPLETCARIYRELGLGGFTAARPYFSAYLASVRSYKKNVYQLPAEVEERVRRHWGSYAERWGYGAAHQSS